MQVKTERTVTAYIHKVGLYNHTTTLLEINMANNAVPSEKLHIVLLNNKAFKHANSTYSCIWSVCFDTVPRVDGPKCAH